MGRSFRTTPIMGIAVCRSEKWEKTQEHSRWRARLRDAIRQQRWERIKYDVRESCWTWGKDGKSWFGPPFTLAQYPPRGNYHPGTYQQHWDNYRKWLRK